MNRPSGWLVMPAALAVGTGGLVAPDRVQAQACTALWPVDTITTLGKGQRPTTNNPKVRSQITGHIVDPGSLGGTCSVTTSIECTSSSDCPMGENCSPLPGDCVPGTGGLTEIGSPGDCELLADSTTTGASLRGAVNFFDSTLGDLAVSINFTCQ